MRIYSAQGGEAVEQEQKWIRATQRWGSQAELASFRIWLYRIAANKL